MICGTFCKIALFCKIHLGNYEKNVEQYPQVGREALKLFNNCFERTIELIFSKQALSHYGFFVVIIFFVMHLSTFHAYFVLLRH